MKTRQTIPTIKSVPLYPSTISPTPSTFIREVVRVAAIVLCALVALAIVGSLLTGCTESPATMAPDPAEVGYGLDRAACERGFECQPEVMAQAWGGSDDAAVRRCAARAAINFGDAGDVETADACEAAIVASSCDDTRWGTTDAACVAWFPGGF